MSLNLRLCPVYQNPLTVLEAAQYDTVGEESGSLCQAHTKKILKEMEGRPFIVGADCTLPTEIAPERVHSVVRAVERLQGSDQVH